MTRLALTAAVLAALAVSAAAQPTPQVKVGQCPSGYASEAAYCVPMRRDAPVAIRKAPGRQCPSGFASEANYCVERKRR